MVFWIYYNFAIMIEECFVFQDDQFGNLVIAYS